jgi:hypothetical protein
MIRRLTALGPWSSSAVIPRLLSSGGSLDHKSSQIGFAIIVKVNQSLGAQPALWWHSPRYQVNSMWSIATIG